MKISQLLIDEMIEHARADDPDECCGMIGGTEDECLTLFRVENIAHSPLRYEMHSEQMAKAYMDIQKAGHEVTGIYHSHTRTAAYPSQTDINLASGWPDSVYFIVSLEQPDEPDVKGFWIRGKKVEDVDLQIT